jgi:RNA polymerase sigma factor (sigma-70 family)
MDLGYGPHPTAIVRKNRIADPDAIPYRARPPGRAETEATVDQLGLVERARRGDHDAFTELARGAVTRLDRAARLILRDPELARDAVQEALIRAWHDLPGLRDPERFDAWLHRLTVNVCLDLVRRRRRRVIEVEIDSIDAPTVSDHASALADREVADAAMRRLDERGRAIVVLHYFLGMPLTDVAATLGIPLGTVKSRLHRALGEMRVAVETERPSPSPIPGGQVV